MSNFKESTVNTLFTLSLDSGPYEESSLISDPEFDQMTGSFNNATKQIQELLMEIELINEDRLRLKQENERLKQALGTLPTKNVQIELLSKIATKALNENYLLKKSKPPSPLKKFSYKIRIKSPSQSSPRMCENFIIPLKKNLDLTSISSSPLKSHRATSSKIRVTRNLQKYPK